MFWPFRRKPAKPAKPETQPVVTTNIRQPARAPYAPSRFSVPDRSTDARRTSDGDGMDFLIGASGMPYPTLSGMTGYAVHQSMTSDHSSSRSDDCSSSSSSSDYGGSCSSDSSSSSSWD